MEGTIRTHGPIERYKPRSLALPPGWQVGSTRFKVYGLLAEGKSLTSEIMDEAERFVRQDVASAVANEGAENGAGFVIVHPGDLGVSTSARTLVGTRLCSVSTHSPEALRG